MNIEEFKQQGVQFELGTPGTTGKLSGTLKGTDAEIQSQLNWMLNIYVQLYGAHNLREIQKKG